MVTFECTILGASLAAVLGMLALNGLPQPYHPLFSVPNFAHATRDGFFLVIESSDPLYDRARLYEFFQILNAKSITEVTD